MKTIVLTLCSILLTICVCVGCGLGKNPNTEHTESQTETQTNAQTDSSDVEDTQNTQDTEKEVLPPSDVVLMEQEKIDWFETSYFNVSDNRIVNMFINSEYETPAEINLYHLFYNGTFSADVTNVSQEELSLLESRYSAMTNLDTSKMSIEDIDEILQKYMNITLEETNKRDIEKMYYLEEYSAYYTCVGDTKHTKYDILNGWTNDDGTITLQYMHDQNLSYDKTVYRVTLKEENGNYYFISNLKE